MNMKVSSAAFSNVIAEELLGATSRAITVWFSLSRLDAAVIFSSGDNYRMQVAAS